MALEPAIENAAAANGRRRPTSAPSRGDIREQAPGGHPWLIRIFGVISIIGGGVQVAVFVLTLVSLFLGAIDLSQLQATGHGSATTLAISITSVALSVVLAVLFILLGVRLLRAKWQKAALLCSVMIACEVAMLVCQFLLTGFDWELIAPGVNMAILVVLQSFTDPMLAEERKVKRQQRSLKAKEQAEDGTLGRDASGRGYLTLNYFNVFWVFLICSVVGLAVELLYHVTVKDPGVYQDRAGLLYGPFSPIYGVGGVLMTVALNRFHRANPRVIFLVSAVIGGVFEIFVSWFFETAFGITAWDYTGQFGSIGGRTSLLYMCMWGVLGVVWVKAMLPALLKAVNAIPWNWRYAVTTACTILMAVDIGLTMASFDCWYEREAGTMDYEGASAIVRFCNDHYDNSFMANRFQTMTIDPANAARM